MHERLSPVEAIMWRAGQDPGLRMIVGNLLILDRPPPTHCRRACRSGRGTPPAAVPS